MFFKRFYLGEVSSRTSIEINPTFDYSQSIEARRNQQIMETGQVNQYKLTGGQFRFSIPFNLTDSSDVSQIRGFWRDQTNISFMTVGSGDFEQYMNCRIINRNDPFLNYGQAQFDKFDGILTLLSNFDQNSDRGVQPDTPSELECFVLDSPTKGRLDNTQYVLCGLRTFRLDSSSAGRLDNQTYVLG